MGPECVFIVTTEIQLGGTPAVCGQDSSVDRVGLGLVTAHQGDSPFQGRGYTMVEKRHHR